MINSYSFGKIEIDNEIYNSDLVIFPDGRVDKSWWREKSHLLTARDLQKVIAACPEVLIAGTGVMGCMKSSPDLEEYLRERGIHYIEVRSGSAVELYNQYSQTKKTAVCIHLTC